MALTDGRSLLVCSRIWRLVGSSATQKEADPRFGAFDFSAAYEEAPADLQELLDSHESLPFRRRGYERDGVRARGSCALQLLRALTHGFCSVLAQMMNTLVERAGFKQLKLESSQVSAGTSRATELAAVPSEIARESPLSAAAAFPRIPLTRCVRVQPNSIRCCAGELQGEAGAG